MFQTYESEPAKRRFTIMLPPIELFIEEEAASPYASTCLASSSDGIYVGIGEYFTMLSENFRPFSSSKLLMSSWMSKRSGWSSEEIATGLVKFIYSSKPSGPIESSSHPSIIGSPNSSGSPPSSFTANT